MLPRELGSSPHWPGDPECSQFDGEPRVQLPVDDLPGVGVCPVCSFQRERGRFMGGVVVPREIGS